MTTTRPLKVFLCHASADKPAVRKLYRYLKERKIDAWFDAEKLIGGQNWRDEIPKAIKGSDAIIVCLSKNSVNKEGYIQKEIKFALDKADEMPPGRIFLIPAKLEECEVPSQFADYHWVNLFEEDGYRRLMKSLRLRAQQIDSITQIPNSPQAQNNLPDEEELESKDTAMDLGGDVNRANIIVENNNVIHVTPQNIDTTSRNEPKLTPAKQRKMTEEITRMAEKEIQKILDAANKKIKLEIFRSRIQFYFRYYFVPFLILLVATVLVIFLTPNLFASFKSSVSEKDGMTLVYVPAGEFTMGRDNGSLYEKPAHTVALDAFWIDQTEVTNAMYAKCVGEGICKEPTNKSSYTHLNYYGNSEFDTYPVVYVGWNMAQTYCEWAGRRLPTEAEWEKAARGTDGRTYPWGNEAPNKELLNYGNNIGDTIAVGSYANGISPYGAYDMAGNVWEWVSDWYDVYPGGDASASTSFGQTYRVLRGGSWDVYDVVARSALRYYFTPSYIGNVIGFRCARSP